MTNEEAIRVFKRMLNEFCNEDSYAPECKDAVDMAIKALEKQMPKKPTIKQDRYNENLYALYCPTCGSYIGMYNKRLKMSDFFNNSNRNICNRCGQAIDCEVEA